MFERFPGDLEQHPLLRIHRRGLARGDPEEIGVEPGDIGDEAAPFRRHPTRGQRVRIVERVGIPPIGRHLADRVFTVDQQPPIAFRPYNITGEPAPDANNGYRLRSDYARCLVELTR